ncbi:MAG TPA: YCF48-related protein [Pseudomonas sp.]|nr:YCF48-related protein [Pseudomonas sp.]
MSEPNRLARLHVRGSFPVPRSLRTVLALCSVLACLPLAASPALAQGDGVQFSIESPKAVQGLTLDIALAGKRLVTVGERGHILYSDDAGRNWIQARVPTRQLLTAVTFVDPQHGWAVGHDALILATQDGGATWTRQYEDRERESPLLDVWFRDRQYGLAVGAYGALLETRNGGRTWNDVSARLDNEDELHLNGIAAVKPSGLVIVGETGALFRSADGGQSWERLESPYDGTLFGALGTARNDTLLIYGLRGNLYRSADFGESWREVTLRTGNGELAFGLNGGTLQADGTLVLVGHGGSFLYSQDDGRSFTVYNRPDRQSLSSVADDGAGRLVLVGQGGVNATGLPAAKIADAEQ